MYSAREASCPDKSDVFPPSARFSTLPPTRAVSHVIRKLRHATIMVLIV